MVFCNCWCLVQHKMQPFIHIRTFICLPICMNTYIALPENILFGTSGALLMGLTSAIASFILLDPHTFDNLHVMPGLQHAPLLLQIDPISTHV